MTDNIRELAEFLHTYYIPERGHTKGSAQVADDGAGKLRCIDGGPYTHADEPLTVDHIVRHLKGHARYAGTLKRSAICLDIDEKYETFEGEDGPVTLNEMFGNTSCFALSPSKSKGLHALYFGHMDRPEWASEENWRAELINVNELLLKVDQWQAYLGIERKKFELFPFEKGNAPVAVPFFGICYGGDDDRVVISPMLTLDGEEVRDPAAILAALKEKQERHKLRPSGWLATPPRRAAIVEETPRRTTYEGDLEEVAKALEFVPAHELDWDEWHRMLRALKHTYGDTEQETEAKRLALEWSARDNPLDSPEITEEEFERIVPNPGPRQLSVGTIFYVAEKLGYEKPLPFTIDDACVLDRFCRMFGDRVRYCEDAPKNKKFRLYNDRLGRWEERPSVFDEIVLVGKAFDREAKKAITRMAELRSTYAGNLPAAVEAEIEELERKVAALIRMSEQLKSVRKSTEIEKAIARSHKAGLTMSIVDFDTDPDLVGVKNGVLDLRTGKLKQHCPGDYIKAALPANVISDDEFNRRMPGSFAEKFMNGWSHPDDIETLFGYLLEKGNPLNLVFLIIMSEGEGKSTLLNVIQALLGDLAAPTNFSVFNSRKNYEAPNAFTASLHGLQCAYIDEAEDGQIQSATFKRATGNSKLPARFLQQQPFFFKLMARILMVGNDWPEIDSFDGAIAERLCPIAMRARGSFREGGRKAERVLDIDQKVELDLMLYIAVRGLMRNRERGKLEFSDDSKAQREGLNERLNKMAEIARELLCPVESGAWVYGAALFEAARYMTEQTEGKRAAGDMKLRSWWDRFKKTSGLPPECFGRHPSTNTAVIHGYMLDSGRDNGRYAPFAVDRDGDNWLINAPGEVRQYIAEKFAGEDEIEADLRRRRSLAALSAAEKAIPAFDDPKYLGPYRTLSEENKVLRYKSDGSPGSQDVDS